MTVLLLGVAALLAAVGTRLAVAAFAAAAASALLVAGPLALAEFWPSATAAGLLVAGVGPRRLALPAAGVAAALIAAGASNAAVVLPAWTLAGICAAGQTVRGSGPAERTWTMWLLAADVPVMIAVCWTIAVDGFSTWPPMGGAVPAVLLVAAAAARMPLAAGALDRAPETGLVLVRAQTVVLLLLGMGSVPVGSRNAFAVTATAAASASFVGAVWAAGRDSVRDAVQEAALTAIALSAVALGWGLSGLAWGALAAGTVLHLVRTADPRGTPAARWLSRVARSGSLGSPIVAVVTAVAAGAVAAGGWLAAVVLLCLLGGLVGRGLGALERRRGSPPGPRAVAVGFAVAAILLGLWAPAAGFPPSLGGSAIPWIPLWALGLLVVGAGAGFAAHARLVPARLPAAPPRFEWSLPKVPLHTMGPVASRPFALVLPLAAFLAVAVGLWLVGLTRGFL